MFFRPAAHNASGRVNLENPIICQDLFLIVAENTETVHLPWDIYSLDKMYLVLLLLFFST